VSLEVDDRSAIRVGGVVIALALVAGIFVVAIAPRLALQRALHVYAYFTELAGLREGAPVRAAGAVVGRVETISLSPAGRAGLLDGHAGAVVLLAIDPQMSARVGRHGVYVISSLGALSAKYLEVLPARSGQSLVAIADGDQVRGLDPPTLDRVLQRTWINLMIAKRFFAEVAPLSRQLRGELTQLAAHINALDALDATLGDGGLTASAEALRTGFEEAERTWVDVLDGRAGRDRIEATIAESQATWRAAADSARQGSVQLQLLRVQVAALSDRLTAAAPRAKATAVISQARELLVRLDQVIDDGRAVWQRWQRREGTLGRLLSDPEFPEDAKDLGKILKRQPWRIFGHPDDLDDPDGPDRLDRLDRLDHDH
jgi:MlaD protein